MLCNAAISTEEKIATSIPAQTRQGRKNIEPETKGETRRRQLAIVNTPWSRTCRFVGVVE